MFVLLLLAVSVAGMVEETMMESEVVVEVKTKMAEAGLEVQMEKMKETVKMWRRLWW